MNQKQHWIIEVADWGTLNAIGTEGQAETWRQHKAHWEHCAASKRLATKDEIKSVKHWDKLSDLIS